MDELYAAFDAALDPDARARFAEAGTREALGRHLTAARAAWPQLAIEPAELGRELARRLGDGDLAGLEVCRASDVYLAIACCRGDDDAIASVKHVIDREVELTAGKTGASPDQVADVKGELARILFVDDGKRPAALREFAGRAELKSYVCVIATRELIRTVQRGRRESPMEDDRLFAMLSNLDDPELEMLRMRYRESVTTGLRVALGKLGDRERALLRYQLVDGWNVDQVGALYGVHRATAARWIAAARETLGALLRDEIARTLAIPIAEVDSIVRLVQSRIDVSLARLIAK
jgi:RNA polymerase sigma-70 factor (ECF subfamily)